MLERVWRKGNPPTLLVGMYVGVSTMEYSTEVPLKTKNRGFPGSTVVKNPPAGTSLVVQWLRICLPPGFRHQKNKKK